MATIIVQFNEKKDKGKLFTYYSGKEDSINFNNYDQQLHNEAKMEIEKILEKYPDENIILVLHDKNLNEAFLFTNRVNDRKHFDKNATITTNDCDELFKRIHVVKVKSEYYLRLHTSPLFDYYYSLLKIDENFGIPTERLESDKRDVCLRQKDRVLYSDMYKRLVDKAQIYSARKSIYVRNRSSHTNEVASIAESICVALNNSLNNMYTINTNLVRTIALAHDIGHTPFGHAGERAIEDFLSNYDLEFKYFKHNYNGVRALTYLEKSYRSYYGLNLNPEVCAGVLGHTSLSNKHKGKTVDFNLFKNYIGKYFNFYDSQYNDDMFDLINVKNVINEDGKKITKLSCKFIEGQIVAIADEIAQKGHDIEDSILTELVNIDEIVNILQSYADYNGRDNMFIKEIYKDIKELSGCPNEKVIAKRITSIIINRLINDLVNEFDNKTENYKDGIPFITKVQNKDYLLIDNEIIRFSSNAKEFIAIFESFTFCKIICSKEVVSYDKHGDNIIKSLLKAYVEDIRLLPKESLRRINIQLYRTDKSFRHDFTSVDVSVSKYIKNIVDNPQTDYDKKVMEVVIREIVDHVSSVTDTYAEHLYEEVFKTKVNSY